MFDGHTPCISGVLPMRVPSLRSMVFLFSLAVAAPACTVASPDGTDDSAGAAAAEAMVAGTDVKGMGEPVAIVPASAAGRALDVKEWRFFQQLKGDRFAMVGYDGSGPRANSMVEIVAVLTLKRGTLRFSTSKGLRQKDAENFVYNIALNEVSTSVDTLVDRSSGVHACVPRAMSALLLSLGAVHERDTTEYWCKGHNLAGCKGGETVNVVAYFLFRGLSSPFADDGCPN
ncbi:MAG: hypothetical protein NVS3B20_18840 [Polyangiales bacterium]